MSVDYSSINSLLEELKKKIEADPNYLKCASGDDFEKCVQECLNLLRKDKIFPAVFEHNGAHAFPDLTIFCGEGKRYGLEIKYSQSGNWHSNGNSVFESISNKNTFFDSYEEIYLLFGRKPKARESIDHLEVKYNKYSEVISRIEVTHSPRYAIDMNFESDGKFLGTDKKYEEFRLLSTEEKNQILREYFTAHREGENKWYIPISSSLPSEDGDVSVGVTLFSSLLEPQKKKLIAEAFILYLNCLFKYPSADYGPIAKYYANEYFVADSSLRDKFSSKGKVDLFNDGNLYPRIYQTFKNYIDYIKEALHNPTPEFVEKCYETWINEQDYAGIQFNEMDPIDVSFNKIITNYKPYPKVAARNGYEAQQQFDLSRLYRLHK